MRVAMIPPNGTPYTTLIPNTLEALQESVGGYIECCAPAELRERGIELIANEEGMLKGLPVNENLLPFLFVGQLVAVSVFREDFVSLSDSQIDYLKQWLGGLKKIE